MPLQTETPTLGHNLVAPAPKMQNAPQRLRGARNSLPTALTWHRKHAQRDESRMASGFVFFEAPLCAGSMNPCAQLWTLGRNIGWQFTIGHHGGRERRTTNLSMKAKSPRVPSES
jgi:hypothetical protein